MKEEPDLSKRFSASSGDRLIRKGCLLGVPIRRLATFRSPRSALAAVVERDAPVA